MLDRKIHKADPGFTARLRRTLIGGLVILAPAAITVYVLVVLFRLMDRLFAPVIDRAIDFQIPGLGILLTLLVVLLLGWLSTNVLGRQVVRTAEAVIGRIPVAKSVYSGTKGILEALSHDQREAFKRVVMIEYPKPNMFALAFVTNAASWSSVHSQLADLVCVYLPTTPNPTSGYLLLVPRADVIEVPFSVEEGIRMVISAGILLPQAQATASRNLETTRP